MDMSHLPGLWRVIGGRIEVYAMVMVDGEQIGNRCLIRAAAEGDVLHAVAFPAEGASRYRLVAYALGRATIERASPEQPDRLDDWINSLAEAVARAHGHYQGGNILLADDIGHYPPQAEIRGGRDLIWAKVALGSVSLFGDPNHLFPTGSMLPMPAPAWVTAGGDGADLCAMTTTEYLAQGQSAGSLAHWQSAMLELLVSGLLALEGDESDRVRRAAHWSERALRQTTAGIAAAMSGRREHVSAVEEDPLLAVCRIVSRSTGFEIPEQPARSSASYLGTLERISRYTSAPARQVTLQGEWWADALGPLVAFWREDGGPVALLPGPRGRYVVHDPANASGRKLDRELARELDPSAYVLYPSLPERPLRVRDLVRFGMGGAQRDIGLMLFMGLAGSLLGLAIPAAMGVLIDEFIPSRLQMPLLQLGALLVLVVIVMVIVSVTRHLAQVRIMGRSANRLQPAVVDRTVRLPSDFLKQFTSADLADRVRVIDAVRSGLDSIVIDGLLSGLFSLTSVVFLLAMAPSLALVAVLVTLPFLAVATWASKAQLPALATAEARGAESSQLVFQLVDNISHLRAAGAEERAFARWGALYQELAASVLRASRVSTRLAGFSTAYGVVGLAAFFITLQAMAPAGLSVGEMVMMVSVYGNFVGTAMGLASSLQHVFLLQPKLQRARVLLAAAPEVDPSRLDPGELVGRIEVNHLTFGYAVGADPILRDISVTFEPSEFVALVGPSGCGKTTLLKLLLGFEHGRTGSILFDGRDITRLDMRAVRRQIGTVLQSDRLTPGTLFENILGVTGHGNEQAWEAARLAGIADEIADMPMGMHTLLTDGGGSLSSGQVQRLLIARALIGNPRIIFFDEATSALDNRSQAIVMHSLERLAVTRVVIAHRLSTVRNADRIIVMDEGRIVQSGRYNELADQPGLFATLVKRQEA